MKKTILSALLAGTLSLSATAQEYIKAPTFFDNTSIGIEVGASTPLHNHAFWGSMRGNVGMHIAKQLTPNFGLGVETAFSINTSSWSAPHSSTAFDNSYLGLYGTFDLFNIFNGYPCGIRPFTIEATIGAGWGHYFVNKAAGEDYNFIGAKAGFNFNYNFSDNITVSLKPSILWNLDGNGVNTKTAFNINRAVFNLMAGVSYRFGNGFTCIRPYDQTEVDDLNGQINALRANLTVANAAADAWQVKANGLAADLDSCRNRKPEIVKEVATNFNSVRFVFFRVGSSNVSTDQMPNVTMIADYMTHHPESKVVIKGYASPEGNAEANAKLAAGRANSVKDVLVKKYKISADRIEAQGEGVGKMFDEESWNRVSVCTLETK